MRVEELHDGERVCGALYGEQDTTQACVYRFVSQLALALKSSATNRSPPTPTLTLPLVFAVTVVVRSVTFPYTVAGLGGVVLHDSGAYATAPVSPTLDRPVCKLDTELYRRCC